MPTLMSRGITATLLVGLALAASHTSAPIEAQAPKPALGTFGVDTA